MQAKKIWSVSATMKYGIGYMQIATASRIFDDFLFFLNPASSPMKLPMNHARSVAVMDSPTV